MNNNRDDASARNCCAECGVAGAGVSLKMCKACMHARYCNAECQHKHWPTHKTACKLRAAELRDEALLKDPPPKEECPICFLPMPVKLISCVSLPPATLSSVPINDFAKANEELVDELTETYYSCCGKSICGGCVHSSYESGNIGKCPFCNANQENKTVEEQVKELWRRVEAKIPLRCFCWLILITTEQTVCRRIERRQSNYTQGQQILVVVRRIVVWAFSIVKGDI